MLVHVPDEKLDLIIATEEDRSSFTADAIVDPIIYRVAEVFLQGRTEEKEKDTQLWSGIEENLRERVTFSDLLVL